MQPPQLPDGPKDSPFVQTLQWLTHPLKFLEACAHQSGDIFTIRISPVFKPQVVVSHPLREDLYPQPKQFQPERFLKRQFAPKNFGRLVEEIGAALAQNLRCLR